MKLKAMGIIGMACLTMAGGARAEDAAWTGHVDLVSKYILRGISSTYGPAKPGAGNANADAPESDHPVLQWGADWTHPDGYYAGYWASQINYSYRQLGKSYADRGITDFQHGKSVENDLYGGYNGKVGELGYTVGLTGYYYLNGRAANSLETKLGLTYGAFSATAQTLLKDVVWGNRGDTYWTLNYSQPLPADITLTASFGFYTYKREGRYLGSTDTYSGVACGAGSSFVVNGCFAGAAPRSSGWRHLIIGFTQPIGHTGVTWGLQGVIAGDNRFGVKQDSRVVGSLSYGF